MGLLDTFEFGYATTPDGARIAYGVRPAPGPDILFLDPTYSFESVIESGGAAVWWETLAALGRVIAVDLRGIGRSDPMPSDFTLDQRVSDAVAVLDAVGASRAVVCGLMPGGTMALLFAALHPDRTISVVAAEAFARYLAAEDYPFGLDPGRQAARRDLVEQWGTGVFTVEGLTAEPLTDPAILRWVGRLERASASTASARSVFDLNCGLDIRDRLPSISVPVLVTDHQGRSRGWEGAAADLARRLPNARYVEVGPDAEQADFDVRRELARFIGGIEGRVWHPRSLATILVTDIVNSTDRAATLGDAVWKAVLDEHDRVVGEQVDLAGGRVVKFMGDGALAVIPLPSRALHCAHEILSAMQSSAIDVRAGLHLGEIDARGDDVGGLAVNLTARVAASAAGGQVLVTAGIAGAVIGAGCEFVDAGRRPLKGIPGEWQLFQARSRQASSWQQGEIGV